MPIYYRRLRTHTHASNTQEKTLLEEELQVAKDTAAYSDADLLQSEVAKMRQDMFVKQEEEVLPSTKSLEKYLICYYGVATISRMLKNIGLFCKRALQKRPVFCKETCIFKHPTHRSHPIEEPYMLSKEPNILAKKSYILQKSPIFYQNRYIFYQKSPAF